MRSLTVAVFATALAIACVTAGARDPREGGATLQVDNRSTFELVIYALRGAERIRLGNAQPIITTHLNLPPDLARGMGVAFIVNPIGVVRPPVTEQITVWPGDTVVIRVPPM